jgi:hypothetical protein
MRFLSLFLIFLWGCGHNVKPEERLQDDWAQDLNFVKQVIDQNYINLEWAAYHQKLDLPAASVKANFKISQIKKDADGKKVLQEFVEQFRDEHLYLRWPDEVKPGFHQEILPKISRTMSGSEVCKMISAKPVKLDFSLKMPEGFKPLKQTKSFRAGTLVLGKKQVGVVRIPSFEDTVYAAACAIEWDLFRSGKKPEFAPALTAQQEKDLRQALREGDPGPRNFVSNSCDAVCWDIFLVRLRNRLLHEFQEVLSDMTAQKIEILLVDLAGASGPNYWEASLRQMLTDKTLVCGDKVTLKNESLRSCDRHRLWADRNYTPSCNLGVVEDSRPCKSSPEYIAADGLYRGALFVLTDKDTAEAAEDLASRLQDNLASLVIGKSTRGSGCGLKEQGEEHLLPYSQGKLILPICVQKRLTGENEIAPIQPDVFVHAHAKTDEYSSEIFREISFR